MGTAPCFLCSDLVYAPKALCADTHPTGVAIIREPNLLNVWFLNDFYPLGDVGPSCPYLVTKVNAFIANLAFRHFQLLYFIFFWN